MTVSELVDWLYENANPDDKVMLFGAGFVYDELGHDLIRKDDDHTVVLG